MKRICLSDAGRQIRQQLTMREVAELYGFTPDRNGFIKCPFHSGDNHGSLKLYPEDRGWHCFGCNAGGSVIDFVMKLFDLTFQQAVVRLDNDFGLHLTYEAPDRKKTSALLENRRAEAGEKARRGAAYQALAEEYRQCWDTVKYFPPVLREDGTIWVHPMYPDALKALPGLEARLDELLEAGIG